MEPKQKQHTVVDVTGDGRKVWFYKSNMASVQFSSVSHSCPTLWPDELQHTRPPCPSPTPRVHPNPFSLSQTRLWTIKKVEHWRIDAFELWQWRKTLESPLDCKEIKPVNPKGNIHWKDWHWSWHSNTLATWFEELTHWKRPWCWERVKVGGEGDNRGWDTWMASPTVWTWVWVNSWSWWWTGRPGML